MFLGIDLGIELVVFMISIVIFNRLFPNLSCWRILMGILRMEGIVMIQSSFGAWMTVLFYQTTLSGLDLTLKFEWLNCNGENATWVGGFDWDGC